METESVLDRVRLVRLGRELRSLQRETCFGRNSGFIQRRLPWHKLHSFASFQFNVLSLFRRLRRSGTVRGDSKYEILEQEVSAYESFRQCCWLMLLLLLLLFLDPPPSLLCACCGMCISSSHWRFPLIIFSRLGSFSHRLTVFMCPLPLLLCCVYAQDDEDPLLVSV